MQAEITQALAGLNFTAIDFETANERRASACAVGVVRVRDGQIVESYQTLLRPRELRVDWRNYQVHGIAETDLYDAPTLADVWHELLPYLHRQPVVAHNSAFDVSVLEHTLRDYDLPIPAFHCLCSVKLSKVVWPQLERHKLDHVAAHFGIPLNHHDALSDARACAEITVHAFRSGAYLPLCFKQRELTAGLAKRAAKPAFSTAR
ncbi:3'-5' exonuclease [Hymenobacter sp. BT770]|uniref:3'-5' exonuclease n=1 Tax=Hymenobacter sp. BT770 TaxID=2886942 RepID=UPI001D125AD3|nr:3'-5' exonuclease [Hymenobacter sp. BT770]MCC3152681.1 3'-5' exonuclease [Hymenobacter sp. BT770]MDO3414754.1 3'-5' exonuclease [Hymenobacter sp. BT770]